MGDGNGLTALYLIDDLVITDKEAAFTHMPQWWRTGKAGRGGFCCYPRWFNPLKLWQASNRLIQLLIEITIAADAVAFIATVQLILSGPVTEYHFRVV